MVEDFRLLILKLMVAVEDKQLTDAGTVYHSHICTVIGKDFLLNGPMAPSSKFQWAIQKINGPYHKPNGPFFTCIFRWKKVCFQVLALPFVFLSVF